MLDVQTSDANDLVALANAYNHALSVKDRPKLIIVDSTLATARLTARTQRSARRAARRRRSQADEARIRWPEDAKFWCRRSARDFRDVMGKRGGT